MVARDSAAKRKTNNLQGEVIKAQPSKGFFIDMLVRDLTIADCILDLIDNAVDKAVEVSGVDVMQVLTDSTVPRRINGKIDVTISRNSVRIVDTCGGISYREARDEVFLFGNPSPQSPRFGLSVYGIGMKRALFKLGRFMSLTSHTATEEIGVDFDVDKWQSELEWNLHFKYVRPRRNTRARSKGEAGGTTIDISRLLPETKTRLTDVSFVNDLRLRVASSYTLFIKAGLTISINGIAAKYQLPTIGSKTFTATRQLKALNGVDLLLIAGLTPTSDPVPHGWYVFCNGRMILEADKSSLTGWGDDYPQFHYKFNHFVGYAYLRSETVDLLPWTTTKQGIVRESPIYAKALKEMKLYARPILNVLGRLYQDMPASDEFLEREILTKAKPISIDALEKTNSTFNLRIRQAQSPRRVSIQYTKPRESVEAIRRQLRRADWSAAKIGSHTFDYYLKKEIG